MFKKTLIFISALTFLLAACTAAPATPDAMMEKSEEPMAEEPHGGEMMEEKPTEEAMMEDESEGGMMEAPAWFSETFTNVRTGQTFSINDYKGKVILVETLAMWCSNCKKQQGQVLELHKLLGERDDFISFGLDIDTNENAADLSNYVQSNGFDWTYAVATPEVAREIGNLYGANFLNPPSTPMLIIDRHGNVHLLPFGIKSAQELYDALQPFLSESM
ncbi:MAG: hypothetical protein Kow002_21360 [Anaerolineales bacterium]